MSGGSFSGRESCDFNLWLCTEFSNWSARGVRKFFARAAVPAKAPYSQCSRVAQHFNRLSSFGWQQLSSVTSFTGR